ncbi:MAG: C10 family peptidase [Bacteroidales bacterium]|nr:C10 family peptidase [Bacteroidales bacterium]
MTILPTKTRTARRLSAAILAALVGLSPAFARQLTVDEAIAAAGASASMQKAPKANKYELKYTVKADRLNTVYVVSDGKGYMVLSADDVATPVLGYADSGSFDPANIPPAMQGWLEQYSEQIAYAAAHGLTVYGAPSRAGFSNIAPLVSTMWNQDSPYNDLCPKVGNTSTYTGCVATAMAQVINTYKWPVTGKGSIINNSTGTRVTLDFSTLTFKWDQMINNYAGGRGTADQRKAVAELMYACGMAAQMKYGTQASGANGINAAAGLVNYLNYDKGLTYRERSYYEIGTWMDMIYAELSAGHPVYYDGSTVNNEGHAFVIDGYSAADGLVHVNWGWGGMSDGYFQITTLSPDQQGIGGASSGFCLSQGAMFGLKKPVEGSTVVPSFAMNGGISLANIANRNTTSNITLTVVDPADPNPAAIFSYSIQNVVVEFGLKFVSSTGQATYSFSNATSISPLRGVSGYSVPVKDAPTANGTYTITSVFRSNGKIYDTPVLIGRVREVKLNVEGNKLTFTPVKESYTLKASNIAPARQMYTGKNAAISATISNDGSAEYLNLISAKLMNGATVVATFDGVMTDVAKGMPATITLGTKLPDKATPGNYQIAVFDASGNEIGRSGNVEVKAVPSGTTTLTVTGLQFPGNDGGAGTKTDPVKLFADNARIKFDLNCISGYFDNGFILLEFYKSAFDRPTWQLNTDVLAVGESDAIDITLNLSELKLGNAYELRIKNGGTRLDSKWITTVDASGIDDVTVDNGSLAIYPNPATDAVTIEAGAAVRAVSIYSLDGTLARQADFGGNEATVALDVDALAPGHYIITVETVSGTTADRLIKR